MLEEYENIVRSVSGMITVSSILRIFVSLRFFNVVSTT